MTEYRSILFRKIPQYMLDKRSQIIMVLFVSAFAIVFINIFKPFGSENWTENGMSSSVYLAWSTLLVIMGMLVVAVSRMIMYRHTNRPGKSITILQYIVWVFIELLLLSGAFTVLAIITGTGTTKDPVEIYQNAMENTIFILCIPYLICIMYFSYQERSAKLKELMGENIGFKPNTLISIRDSRGVLQLSIAKENLIYIESADNYICIWYLRNEQLKKQLMRITMKEISEQLADTNIVRCHRSYLVNLDLVKIMRREKENLFLELGVPNVKEIPISKTYGEQVLRRLVPVS